MPLGAQVWTLDWLRFDPSPAARDSYGVQWILTEERGFWGAPKPEADFNSRLNQHGVVRTPGWKQQRTISLTGRCYALDFRVLREAEAQVCGLLSDPTTPGLLTCYSEFGPLECEVYLDDDILCVPLEVISEPGIEFSIQVVAPDPRKYTPDWRTLTARLAQDSGDGLDFEAVTVPDEVPGLYFGEEAPDAGLVFGTSNATGFIDLVNAGTAPTMPVFTLYGPLTTPTLTTAHGQLHYNGTLGAGQRVVIDPAVPSVLLGGTADRRQLLYPANFSAFAIPSADREGPGRLTVGLIHDGPVTDTGYVEATYRYAWF